jgi:hypothetical protein
VNRKRSRRVIYQPSPEQEFIGWLPIPDVPFCRAVTYELIKNHDLESVLICRPGPGGRGRRYVSLRSLRAFFDRQAALQKNEPIRPIVHANGSAFNGSLRRSLRKANKPKEEAAA